jgi:hypothetical protein
VILVLGWWRSYGRWVAGGEARQAGRRRLRELQLRERQVLGEYEKAVNAVAAAETERDAVIARADERVAAARARRALVLAALGESLGTPARAAAVADLDERDVRSVRRGIDRDEVDAFIRALSTADRQRARGRPRRTPRPAPDAAPAEAGAAADTRRWAARAEAVGGPTE